MGPSSLAATSATSVAIVLGCCFRYDAISAAAIDTLDALRADPRFRVILFTSYNDVPERAFEIVQNTTELLMHPHFLAADMIIYHFGIYNPLLDVMIVGNGRARQAAFFHNITPAEYMPPSEAETIAKSLKQLNNLRFMDRIWPVSRTNAEMLQALEFDPTRIDVIPLAVGAPEIGRLATKSSDRIEILFLSRIVRSKGIIDLIDAIGAIPPESLPPFRLRIAGNLAHSHSECIAEVKSLLTERGLEDRVEFLGTVSDQERSALLRSSHILAIPSYHEGFGKPVIEGIRAGCVPIGYAAHNLRYIANGLGRMIPVGDVLALSRALTYLINGLRAAYLDPNRLIEIDCGALSLPELDRAAEIYVAQFDTRRVQELTRQHVDSVLCTPATTAVPYPWMAAARSSG